MTVNKVPANVRAYFSKMGKRSAKLRMERTTPGQREEIARNAALKRWEKAKAAHPEGSC